MNKHCVSPAIYRSLFKSCAAAAGSAAGDASEIESVFRLDKSMENRLEKLKKSSNLLLLLRDYLVSRIEQKYTFFPIPENTLSLIAFAIHVHFFSSSDK